MRLEAMNQNGQFMFPKALEPSIFFNTPVMFPAEYPLDFAHSSATCAIEIAPSNIRAIVFL
jgi:hypothetical protein